MGVGSGLVGVKSGSTRNIGAAGTFGWLCEKNRDLFIPLGFVAESSRAEVIFGESRIEGEAGGFGVATVAVAVVVDIEGMGLESFIAESLTRFGLSWGVVCCGVVGSV